MNKDALRTRIEAELISGASATELAVKYDTPYATINNWKKALLAEAPNTKISELTNQTVATLEVIRDVAKAQAPAVAGKIDRLIDGVEGLKSLEPEFHSAMLKAVKLAQNFLDATDDEGNSTLSVKDWQTITSTLSMAFGALFNKAGTTVNVAQTNVTAESQNLAFFKASQRV